MKEVKKEKDCICHQNVSKGARHIEIIAFFFCQIALGQLQIQSFSIFSFSGTRGTSRIFFVWHFLKHFGGLFKNLDSVYFKQVFPSFLASPEREAPAGSSSRQPMSYVDQAPGPPTGSAVSRPPPLPPKSKSQSQSDDSMDPIMSSSGKLTEFRIQDWLLSCDEQNNNARE